FDRGSGCPGDAGPRHPKFGVRGRRARLLHRTCGSRITESRVWPRELLDLAATAGAIAQACSRHFAGAIAYLLPRAEVRGGDLAARHADGELEHLVSQPLLLGEPIAGNDPGRASGECRRDAAPLAFWRVEHQALKPRIVCRRWLAMIGVELGARQNG